MDERKQPRTLGNGSYGLVPDATTDELLNDATEWLQYAKGLTELMSDMIGDSDILDRRHLMLAMGAIGVLTDMGTQCAMQAHARMQWDKV
ncbi:hypothetical protein L2Y94_14920 [Luteibacter aegosomatis]|uniref:hypothetical protein n=1 Tax=Luteibacter aegosomatis TaxID=2911537 RepID=UPI001FF7B49A|nr:hypothetical protein [Luteibacter aegosomatis]UPG84612.1 hypothetical protein L2Y94_14920 [Luteibacter aegosomatis]